MATNLRGRNSYGDDEPSKPRQTDEAKPVLAPEAAPVPAVAATPPSALFKDNNVPAAAHAQEATLTPTAAQKAVDPRAPPQPAVNQQLTKLENNPYAIEEEADNYTGWDAAVSGANGAGGNDNGGYGGYGYDTSGGAGAYGDGNASGSPAIKEDGCVFILNFSYNIVCTAKIFYEAREGIGRLGLVSRNSRRGLSGKTRDWFSKGSMKEVGLNGQRRRRAGIKRREKFIHPTSTTLLARVITISTAANISIEDLGGQESILLCHLPTATTTTTPTSIRELASRTALRYTKDSLCARGTMGIKDWIGLHTAQISTSTKEKKEKVMTPQPPRENSPPFVWPHCHHSAVIKTDWASSRFMGDFGACIFAFFFLALQLEE